MNKFSVFLVSVRSKFAELPSAIKVSIAAVVTWLVSMVLANLILLVPFLQFLEQFQGPLSLALAAAVISYVERIVPDAYGRVAIAALQLVLAVLAVFGIGAELAAMGALPALLQ
jgi:hypothetical protein